MLKAAYLNETEKLLARKKYLVLLIVDAAFCVFAALARFISLLIGDGVLKSSLVFGDLPIDGISLYFLFFLPLIALLGSADLFGAEVHEKTLRMLIQRPVARRTLFSAKVAAIFTLAAVFAFFHLVVLLLLRLIFDHSLSGAGFAFGAYALDLLPVIVVVLFFALLNQTGAGSASSVALSVVVYLVVVFIGRYVAPFSGLVFTEYLSWHNLWLGSVLPAFALLPKIGILLGSALIFAGGGLILFERKEI